jgi:hypothetical protein
LKSDRVEVIENYFFQLLVYLLLFPQNNIPLPFDGRRIELRILEDITNDVDNLGDIVLETLGIVNSLFPRCVGVEVSAHVFDLKLQSVLGATTGTLESHVLEEVSGSIGGICFRPRTSIYPDADGSGLSMGVRFSGDCEAV